MTKYIRSSPRGLIPSTREAPDGSPPPSASLDWLSFHLSFWVQQRRLFVFVAKVGGFARYSATGAFCGTVIRMSSTGQENSSPPFFLPSVSGCGVILSLSIAGVPPSLLLLLLPSRSSI